MTKRPSSRETSRNKLVIVALLTIGGSVLIGWIVWLEIRLQQQRQQAVNVLPMTRIEETLQRIEANQKQLQNDTNFGTQMTSTSAPK